MKIYKFSPFTTSYDRIGDGRIFTWGINFGPQTWIVWENDTHLVFKSKAHKTWSGIGLTRNVKTEYYFCEKSGDKNIKVLASVQPGYQWRKAVDTLLKELESDNSI